MHAWIRAPRLLACSDDLHALHACVFLCVHATVTIRGKHTNQHAAARAMGRQSDVPPPLGCWPVGVRRSKASKSGPSRTRTPSMHSSAASAAGNGAACGSTAQEAAHGAYERIRQQLDTVEAAVASASAITPSAADAENGAAVQADSPNSNTSAIRRLIKKMGRQQARRSSGSQLNRRQLAQRGVQLGAQTVWQRQAQHPGSRNAPC